MKFSHKSLHIATFLSCAFIFQHVYSAPVQPNSNIKDVAILEKATSELVNIDIPSKKSEDDLPSIDTINIHADDSTPSTDATPALDITIDDNNSERYPDEEDEIPGWLDMYLAYLVWLWGNATWITSLIVTNVLPVVFFIAACLLTAEILVLAARGISECLGMGAVVIIGPTERTRLLG